MTHAERVSRWARRFVLVGATLLVVRQVGEVVGIARRTAVPLGVLGFVLHTVFGKAYALLPPYFDCDLATTRLMPVHLACSLAGTLLLAGAGGCRPSTRIRDRGRGGWAGGPDVLVLAGRLAATLGVSVHLALLIGLFRERFEVPGVRTTAPKPTNPPVAHPRQ